MIHKQFHQFASSLFHINSMSIYFILHTTNLIQSNIHKVISNKIILFHMYTIISFLQFNSVPYIYILIYSNTSNNSLIKRAR